MDQILDVQGFCLGQEVIQLTQDLLTTPNFIRHFKDQQEIMEVQANLDFLLRKLKTALVLVLHTIRYINKFFVRRTDKQSSFFIQGGVDSISIKQEQQQHLLFGQQGPTNQQQCDIDASKQQRKNLYKQQYSPYGSPAGGQGSPGYLPPRGTSSQGGPFGSRTPPRPASGPGGPTSTQSNNQQSGSLQINQAQQLHINQQGGNIQVIIVILWRSSIANLLNSRVSVRPGPLSLSELVH